MSISIVDETNVKGYLNSVHYKLDWLDPDPNNFPNQPERESNKPVSNLTSVYRLNPGGNGIKVKITIDPKVVTIHFDRRNPTHFSKNFNIGDSVLLADNIEGRMPIHLSFCPPISGLWTQVSAQGDNGINYYGEMDVCLYNGDRFRVRSPQGTISANIGDAPIIGAKMVSDETNGITDVWVDVAESGIEPGRYFIQVAINDLYFTL